MSTEPYLSERHRQWDRNERRKQWFVAILGLPIYAWGAIMLALLAIDLLWGLLPF